jgi:two-component system, OmpR family, response regulator
MTDMPSPAHARPLLKAFLVEDSAVIQHNLIETLQELAPVSIQGVAADELSALQWLENAGADVRLVIVDIFLHHGSGLGVLKKARHSPQRQFVILSNYATPAMRNECLAHGAVKVFDKSTEIEALIHYCEELASQPATAIE